MGRSSCRDAGRVHPSSAKASARGGCCARPATLRLAYGLRLLLLAIAVASVSGGNSSAAAKPPASPRVYVYSLPERLAGSAGGFAALLARRLRTSRYNELDGDKADYYYIPASGWFSNQTILLSIFDWVRQEHPWWNRTRDAGGPARHAILMMGDHGPGDVAFDRPMRLDSGVPSDVNPPSLTRNVLFLMCNGHQDTHLGDAGIVHFQLGE